MPQFSDQDLSAYIDGELTEAQTRALSDALQTDLELAARLEALKLANQEFLSAHIGIAEEPIPQHLLELIDMAEPVTPPAAKIVPIPSRLERARAWALPLAACFVLAIGVAFGTQISEPSASRTDGLVFAGPVERGTLLYQALEATPSQESLGEYTPILTYAAGDGAYCREVETPSSRSLGCRSVAGGWTIVATVAQSQVMDADAYSPASAETSVLLDTLAEQLMEDVPLSAETERVLLSRSWRSVP